MLKNIIFDFGGVLFDIDYKRTERAFVDLGFTGFHRLYSQASASSLFEDLETGKITAPDFYGKLRKAGNSNAPDGMLHDAWCAILIGFRKPSMEYLRQLAREYRIFLFSNTNAIHWPVVQRMCKEQLGSHDVHPYFSKTWLSFEIGVRKPHRDAFEFVLNDAKLDPAETIFIDDTALNLMGAKEAGMHTYLIKPSETVMEIDYQGVS